MKDETIGEVEVIILPIEGSVCGCTVGENFKAKIDPDIYEGFIGCYCGGCGGRLQ